MCHPPPRGSGQWCIQGGFTPSRWADTLPIMSRSRTAISDSHAAPPADANESTDEPAAADAMTYAQSGVDIDQGDEVVRRIRHHLRRTHGPRVLGRYGAFAGAFRLDYNEKLFKRNYKDPVLLACSDSVGSKVLLACEMGVYDTIGQDCVAMNVNDLIVQGAEPGFFVDYIGIHRDEPAVVERIINGVAEGCLLAGGCALLGGETAVLPDLYAPGQFDLAGFSVGVCELKRMIDIARIEAGDVVLGLTASGVHSNGFSLVRAIVKKKKLKLDKVYPDLDNSRSLGQVLLTPTRIYTKPIVQLLRRYRVKHVVSGMAHITGGGLGGNVNRALPDDVDVTINTRAWAVPPVFEFIKRQGNVDDDEMMRVFNMGIGFVLIVRPFFADSVQRQLEKSGETVHVLGKVIRGTGRVRLK